MIEKFDSVGLEIPASDLAKLISAAGGLLHDLTGFHACAHDIESGECLQDLTSDIYLGEIKYSKEENLWVGVVPDEFHLVFHWGDYVLIDRSSPDVENAAPKLPERGSEHVQDFLGETRLLNPEVMQDWGFLLKPNVASNLRLYISASSQRQRSALGRYLFELLDWLLKQIQNLTDHAHDIDSLGFCKICMEPIGDLTSRGELDVPWLTHSTKRLYHCRCHEELPLAWEPFCSKCGEPVPFGWEPLD